MTNGVNTVTTTTKASADGKTPAKTTTTNTAVSEYGLVKDDLTKNVWPTKMSNLNVRSVVATGTAARGKTTLTVDFVTPATDKLDFLGVELPRGWGNVLRGKATSLGGATLS